jgi:hypothetical protein
MDIATPTALHAGAQLRQQLQLASDDKTIQRSYWRLKGALYDPNKLTPAPELPLDLPLSSPFLLLASPLALPLLLSPDWRSASTDSTCAIPLPLLPASQQHHKSLCHMVVEKLIGVVSPPQSWCASVHKQLLTSTGM